jgi:DNA-binding MurR/RpiR family transcriptional regulator
MKDEIVISDNLGEQLGPRLRLLMKGMSDTEARILQYCLDLGEKISSMNINEIASHCAVSSALVVKVAKKCGYLGFRELRNALRDYANVKGEELHQELNPNDDPAIVVRKVFMTAIKALQDTLLVLDPTILKRIADLLVSAKRVLIIGVGGSGALALDAYHKFLRIGIDTKVCTDSHLMVMEACLLKTSDMIIAFSHSGRTRAIFEALKAAKLQGAITVSITNDPESKIKANSDFIISSVAMGSPITGENAAARIAQLNILDSLFVLVAQHDYERSLKNLSKTIDVVAPLRI